MNQARLIVEGRGNWVYTHHIGESGKVTIGRASENDVRLGDLHSSSRHAEIVREGSDFYVQDLGSRNGTFMNGIKVDKGKLTNGSTIKIGITTMSFLTGDDESFCTQGSSASFHPPHNLQEPESALQPMIERLDTLKTSLERTASVNASEMLGEAVEDLQKELREAKATIRRLTVVNEFSRMLALETSPLQLVASALQFMATHVEAENGFIMQVDPNTRKWAVRARFGSILDWSRSSEGEESKTIPMSLTIVEQTVRTGKPVVSQSAVEDSRFDEAKSIVNLGIRSLLCFPMNSKGGCVGVCYVDRRMNPSPFGLGEEKLFEALTDQLGQVLYPE